MKCPVCRALYRSPEIKDRGSDGEADPNPSLSSNLQHCRRCGVDLSPLIRLHDQAVWCHNQALQSFKAGDYLTASDWNDRALAIDASQANFHALAGQLWAWQGEFGRAIAAWKKTQQLDSKHLVASAGLQYLEGAIAPSLT